jgi:hypothetical protein
MQLLAEPLIFMIACSLMHAKPVKLQVPNGY